MPFTAISFLRYAPLIFSDDFSPMMLDTHYAARVYYYLIIYYITPPRRYAMPLLRYFAAAIYAMPLIFMMAYAITRLTCCRRFDY